MFGREKFSSRVAEQALARANEHLEPDGIWRQFDNLTLYRFRRPDEHLRYREGHEFTLTAAEVDLTSLPWLEPNMPSCVEVEGDDLEDPEDDDSAAGHLPLGDVAWRWLLNPRVPLNRTGVPPVASVQHGELYPPPKPEQGYWQGTIEGGPCDGPAPVLLLQPPRPLIGGE